MKLFWKYITLLFNYKKLIILSIGSHLLTAIFTVVSIPMVIPFFQILFDRDSYVAVGNSTNLIEQIKLFFSNIIQQNEKSIALLYICLFLLASFLLKNIFRYLSMYFMTPVRNGIIRDLRQELFSKYISLPLSFFHHHNKGDLLSRISVDIQDIEWSILNVIEAVFKAPLVIIGSILFMIYISPGLTLFVLILLLFTVFIIGGISRSLKRKSSEAQVSLGKILIDADEAIGGIRIVKSFLAGKYLENKFLQANESYRSLRNKVLWRRDLSSPLSEFLGILIVVILLGYGSSQVFGGVIKAENFFAFIFAFYQVIEPSKSLASAYYNIQKGIASAERVEEIKKLQNPLEKSVDVIELDQFNSDITLNNVGFCYPGEQIPSLNGINLRIHKGEKLALVGRSGAGKSTIFDLLQRFYDCSSGNICIDGIDVKSLQLQSLRSLFSLVAQEPILFHTTILENIAFGDKNPDIAKAIAAAKKSHAHEFIIEKKLQYESPVGERGNLLSGGEKQRISLARALYHDTPVLLLDEPMSSLDPKSERLIQLALEDILKDKTAIIIAHGMKSIQFADRIVVLKNGCLIEEGSHEELITMDGEYYNFVQLHSF